MRVGVLSGSRNAAISSSFMSFAGGLVICKDLAIRSIVLPDTGPGLVPKVCLSGPVLFGASVAVLDWNIFEGLDL